MNQEEGQKKTMWERFVDFCREVLKIMILSAATAIVQIGITHAFAGTEPKAA